MGLIGAWLAALTPGDWAAFLTGVGTLVLAGVAVYQGRTTKKQLEIGTEQADTARQQAEIAQEQAETARRQAEAAESSVAAALEVQREAVRARADQNAPRVFMFFGAPLEPRIDSYRSGMPGAEGPRLLEKEPFERSRLAPGVELIYSRDKSTFVWFSGVGILVNEGPSHARVRVGGELRFVEGRNPMNGSKVELPVVHKSWGTETVVLPPGCTALFMWAAGKSVGDWVKGRNKSGVPIPEQDIWFWVDVFDTQEVGVRDTLMAHFKPDLLRPVQSLEGHWKVNEPGTYGEVAALPAKRGYTHEGPAYEDLSQMYDHYGLDKFGHLLDDRSE